MVSIKYRKNASQKAGHVTKTSAKQNGFTVIELLIVILAIAILVGIVGFTYHGIQVKSRNTTRQTDIQAIQTKLEAFYSQNGYYPSLKNMNDVGWRSSKLPELDGKDLIDPQSKATIYNVKLANSPAPKIYAYQVTDSNGNSCENNDTNCAKYTLTATLEGKVNGSKDFSKQNLD